MSEMKTAILDAKYIDMISAADFIVQDLGLPEYDADGMPMPQATDVAAALFRWAAGAELSAPARAAAEREPAAKPRAETARSVRADAATETAAGGQAFAPQAATPTDDPDDDDARHGDSPAGRDKEAS